jgi:hypothetical protein
LLSQAAIELQLKYASGPPQLAVLRAQMEEQQRELSRWEGRLGRQLEVIVGIQRTAMSVGARSSGASVPRQLAAAISGSSARGSGMSLAATPASSSLSGAGI